MNEKHFQLEFRNHNPHVEIHNALYHYCGHMMTLYISRIGVRFKVSFWTHAHAGFEDYDTLFVRTHNAAIGEAVRHINRIESKYAAKMKNEA